MDGNGFEARCGFEEVLVRADKGGNVQIIHTQSECPGINKRIHTRRDNELLFIKEGAVVTNGTESTIQSIHGIRTRKIQFIIFIWWCQFYFIKEKSVDSWCHTTRVDIAQVMVAAAHKKDRDPTGKV